MTALRRRAGRWFAAATGVFRLRILVANVQGMSMAPAYRSGDRLLVVRNGRALRAGDVVVSRVPDTYRLPAGGFVVKRVAALGGQPSPGGSELVPPGQVYLLGDRAEHSLDSRAFGPIAERLVIGRVVRRLAVVNRVEPVRPAGPVAQVRPANDPPPSRRAADQPR